MVIEGHGREVGVGKLEVSHVSTVDLELELIVIMKNWKCGPVCGREVLDRMVEIELLNLGTRGDRFLDLGHDHILGLRCEHFALLGIEVCVVGVNLPLALRSLITPCNAKLDIVILERDEGEGGLPVLTEGEAERVELGVVDTIVETTGKGLGGGERREGGGDESRVGGVLFIDHLTTDEKLNLRDRVGPVGRVRVGKETTTIDGHEVDVVEKITLALEANGGHAIVRDVALNDLTLDSLGEVRVTLVGRTEKADFGLADEVHILSTDSDELGDTTRHFIL